MRDEAPIPLPAQGAILLVDKAEGWTSHDVVAKARRALGTRKVGHAGTLDPMATGLLVLGAGAATRLLTHLVGLDKRYTATIRLGAATVTDDREGETLRTAAPSDVAALAEAPDRIAAAVAALTGDIEQAPSAVSAIKVDGRRAYERVRAGEQVELRRRPVTVHAFELGAPRPATTDDGAAVFDVDATVRCSSGTYVRALARDLGEALGVGGHLTALRRTSVGPFDVTEATPTPSLAEGRVERLLEPAEVARALFPELRLSGEQAVDLGHGKRLELEGHADARLLAAVSPEGRLVGLVEVRGGRSRVVTNFPTPDADRGAGS
ncbi:tRNA pseudouridine(55) synthase TruB [Leucobacter massiliensis]|uniref:tRNA pseudouridine synthase B n=1 Tax=Leucobacter massiliensis TaxID=1686285 RepID=A0A2S9QLW6_9MICO|nr:tRNA pseudouridine(55) synthase TruB [Leucobacter massiliensis]PRI10576.1 tRNA pseudouridine(55) synthase TruB [Leucobacter massiliensis]